MLLAGDEFGHTQNGNNNAYAQDNEISWLDWDKTSSGGEDLLRGGGGAAEVGQRQVPFGLAARRLRTGSGRDREAGTEGQPRPVK